jgi:hypothetical protein
LPNFSGEDAKWHNCFMLEIGYSKVLLVCFKMQQLNGTKFALGTF